jgi:hypothetical protein
MTTRMILFVTMLCFSIAPVIVTLGSASLGDFTRTEALLYAIWILLLGMFAKIMAKD